MSLLGWNSCARKTRSELDEAAYEDAGAVEGDSYRDEDSRLKDQETLSEEEIARNRKALNENTYQEANADDDRSARTNTDFSEFEPSQNTDVRDKKFGESVNPNEDFRSFSKRRQSNRYIENNDASDQQEAARHFTNRDVNNYKSNRVQTNNRDNQVNKRTDVELHPSPDKGDSLFDSNQGHMSKVDKNKYNNNEDLDSSEQGRHIKQYYNKMIAENQGRDRREVNKPINGESSDQVSNSQDNKELEKSDKEGEEAAIKRHIKKLSGEELEELLNSLSDEKRSLLKKIIDDNTVEVGGDNMSKREITKKAGAVEENNYMEGVQSDSSKIQGISPSADTYTESSVSQSTEKGEINKQTGTSETSDISTTKNTNSKTDSENKAELSSRTDERKQEKSDNSLTSCDSGVDAENKDEPVSIVRAPSKIENKRETNLDDFDDMPFDNTKLTENELNPKDTSDPLSDQEYCSQDEDASQLMDDEAQLHNNGQTQKREILTRNRDDLSESLEDSFPNSNAYHDDVSYSGPLVRVKRTDSNQIVKKRAAGILPDAKVGYLPYRAENDDEDNDEGNEFDDEGFYDETSNFAKNKPVDDDSANSYNSQHHKRDFKSNSVAKSSANDKIETDTSLGSDTDGVISGVEGVDDNLMLSSGTRNRRKVDASIDTTDIKMNQPMGSISLADEKSKAVSENLLNALNSQENDAFGPLERNYNGDSGRYKRIRRVKQSHEDIARPNQS